MGRKGKRRNKKKGDTAASDATAEAASTPKLAEETPTRLQETTSIVNFDAADLTSSLSEASDDMHEDDISMPLGQDDDDDEVTMHVDAPTEGDALFAVGGTREKHATGFVSVQHRDRLPLLKTRERVLEMFFRRREARVIVVMAIIIAVIFIALVVTGTSSDDDGASLTPQERASRTATQVCSVFCHGRILSAVQELNFLNDSKEFVDMPLREGVSPAQVVRDFEAAFGTDPITSNQMWDFIDLHFDYAGSDIVHWSPPDFNQAPPKLERIDDAELRAWALKINDLWGTLGRQVKREVSENAAQHTLIAPKSNHMIVAGGRFREMYYWDTYFIIRGLLLSDMRGTAIELVDNLLHLIEIYGYVPNGNRVYYLTRSQPPFLTFMVNDVYEAWIADKNADADAAHVWLHRALLLLDKEYDHWMTLGRHAVRVKDSSGQEHVANRYYAHVTYPRPESWRADTHTARYATSDAERTQLFSNLTAAAESGWDFSSRWFADRRHLNQSDTTNVVPCDLNGFFFGIERTLAKLHKIVPGGEASSLSYLQAARKREELLFSDVLWNSNGGHWADFDSQKSTQLNFATAANYLPLWAVVKFPFRSGMNLPPHLDAEKVMDALDASGLVLAGGVVTTLEKKDGQQWDWPDAWAPLQLMIIESLIVSGDLNTEGGPEGIPAPVRARLHEMAERLTLRWLNNMWLRYVSAGKCAQDSVCMFEKYSATTPGAAAGGGEYPPQAGFGWTNGVALVLLDRYYDRLRLDNGVIVMI